MADATKLTYDSITVPYGAIFLTYDFLPVPQVPVFISTSTNASVPFYFTQEENLFKLSDGTLVCFFCKPGLHYALSKNHGNTWTVTNFNKQGISFSCVQEGNNFIVALSPASTSSYVTCKTLTYNTETQTFSIADTSTISDFGVGNYAVKFLYQDNLYICFPVRLNYRSIYCYISSDKTSWSSNQPAPLPDLTSNSVRSIDAILFDTNKILVTVSSATGRLYYYIGTKGESNYSWVGPTQINDIAIDPLLNTFDALTLYKVSDTEIYLACRTSNGYVFYTFNGSTWSSPLSMSSNTDDTSGRFTKVNGTYIWAYINVEQQPDTSYLYSIKYRLKNQSGWGVENDIISDQTKQIRRLTVETTENNKSVLQYCFSEESSSPYQIYFNKFELAMVSGEIINVDESFVVSDSTILKPSQEFLSIDESLSVQDEKLLKPSQEFLTINETIEVDEDINIDSYRRVIDIDENFIVSDEIDLSTYRRVIDVEESITVDETTILDSDQFINIDESLYVSDEITTSLNKIDIYEEIIVNDDSFIGFPVILDSEEQIIVSDEVKSRTSINYPYQIIAFNPLIVVSKTNPIRISIINVDDLDNIDWDGATVIPGVSDFNNITYNTLNECVYIITDSGKIIKIPVTDLENQETISVSLFPNLKDSTVLSNRLQLYSISDSNTGELILLDEREMKSVSLDIKYVQEKVNFIPLDIRSIHTKNMPLNIIVLETNSKSIGLSFSFLKYAFDDASQYPIDYTKIQVKINNVDMSVLNDVDMSSIVITHNIESDKSNASFNLYRRFDDLNTTLNNVTSQITNKNTVQIFINGVKEFDGKISNLNVHTENEIVSVTCVGNRPNEQKNVVRIPFSRLNTNLHLYDCLLSNITMDNPPLDPDDETPEYYLGVEVDLGIQRTQQVQRWISMSNALSAIEQGTFQAQQNWTYFWSVAVTRFWTDWVGKRREFSTNAQYIGTSLSPAFSEDFKITYAGYKTQKTYPDTETHLGVYRIGQAPYLPISAPNGMYISKDRWEDRPNGLYRVTDASFNFVPVARNHAQIEYEKLKNINGDILPRTSADVEITLDAYYFYNIKLLSRLNFSNTTKDNIYNKQNGFPVSVKLIVISTANMRVQLQTDNSLSSLEINALEDKKYSTDNYEKDGSEGLENYKYDLVTGHKVV